MTHTQPAASCFPAEQPLSHQILVEIIRVPEKPEHDLPRGKSRSARDSSAGTLDLGEQAADLGANWAAWGFSLLFGMFPSRLCWEITLSGSWTPAFLQFAGIPHLGRRNHNSSLPCCAS